MKTYAILLILLLSFAGFACQTESIPTTSTVAIVEGTVSYFPPTMAIGGEADPAGFILTDYRWVVGAPSFSYSRVYLQGIIDSSNLNQRVRVSGAVVTLSAGGVETPRRLFPRVQVQQYSLIQ